MINFEKVSKARSLFKDRGAIRREYIRDEIAYSWVRSRLYSKKKVEFNEEKIHIFIDEIEYSADEIVKFINTSLKNDEEKYCVFIVGEDGKLKNSNYKMAKLGIKIPDSFREEHIGTNGIGIAFSLKKSVIVYGSEHYSAGFDEYISASILDIPFEIDNGVLALIAKKDGFDEEIINEIKNIDYSLIDKRTYNNDKKVEKSDIEETQNCIENNECISRENIENVGEVIELGDYFKTNIPYCLLGNSKEKLSFKALVMSKALTSSLINIYGSKGSGKEYLARFIHENSSRNKDRFIRINPRIDIEYVIDKEIDDFQSGTLYIENIDELKKSTRSKIQRKINCKLVNSEVEVGSNKRDVAFFVSKDKNETLTSKNGMFLTALKLEIDAINYCEDDLQYIISKLIENKLKSTKGIKNLEMFSPIYIHAKSKEVLKEVVNAPLLSYNSLEKIFDSVIDITAKTIEVKQLKVEDEKEKCRNEFKELKDVELEYIREVMAFTNNNIAKASEILGIGRTTIYRKLKSD